MSYSARRSVSSPTASICTCAGITSSSLAMTGRRAESKPLARCIGPISAAARHLNRLVQHLLAHRPIEMIDVDAVPMGLRLSLLPHLGSPCNAQDQASSPSSFRLFARWAKGTARSDAAASQRELLIWVRARRPVWGRGLPARTCGIYETLRTVYCYVQCRIGWSTRHGSDSR